MEVAVISQKGNYYELQVILFLIVNILSNFL